MYAIFHRVGTKVMTPHGGLSLVFPLRSSRSLWFMRGNVRKVWFIAMTSWGYSLFPADKDTYS